MFVALAVVSAALHDPLQAAIAVGGLVGIVLIQAGVHTRLSGAFAGVLLRDRVWKHSVAEWG